MTENEKPYFVSLSNRGLIKINGPDRYQFLQALVTNDVELLKDLQSVYACLLTPQGKFLHDFFVTEDGETLLIDCEGGARAKDLYMRLMMYKLRSDITLELNDDNPVYAVIDHEAGYPDPRHPAMGSRTFTKPKDIEERDFIVWDQHRIALTVPDGSRDMIVEKSTMLESRVDKRNGICFKKGCYVGQELTARMHYRGLAKKHLYAVRSDTLPELGENIMQDGKLVGEMRSKADDVGIALLKDGALDGLDMFNVLPFTEV